MTTDDWRWQQHHFRAMNTNIAAQWWGSGAHGPGEVEELFRSCERSLSRFDESSDLAQLNRNPAATCPVSASLYAALEVALWAARMSGGIYDPTLLDALKQAGYDRSFEMVGDHAAFQPQASGFAVEAGPPQSAPAADWRNIQLLPEQQAVRRPPGLHIDLGGLGKGWAVDRAADRLHGEGPYLINAGGDLYAAGQPDGCGGWLVYIEHPWRPQHWMAQVQLKDTALATSTVTKRRWRQDGVIQHHLIDPRTGKPAQSDLASVTVLASRTVIADVLAKVVLLLGAQAGLAFLSRAPGAAALVQRSDGQILCTPAFEHCLLALDEHGRHLEPA